ncbi:hypothetical protein [Pseudomonas cavernae]|uniref:hypothetical protein n=1 Tax=Pseudomonas cavernae TaxID=2320867 RepID=UPI0013C45A67|nr:hypothetical protein [Pseudomonas cavernae]
MASRAWKVKKKFGKPPELKILFGNSRKSLRPRLPERKKIRLLNIGKAHLDHAAGSP